MWTAPVTGFSERARAQTTCLRLAFGGPSFLRCVVRNLGAEHNLLSSVVNGADREH